MFYFPLKLRTSKNLIIPKGPSFKKARTYEVNLDGTKLKFKAPKDSQQISKYKFSFSAKNTREKIIFHGYGEGPHNPKDLSEKWERATCYEAGWAFNGPWFSGPVSDLKLLVKAYRIKNYPESVSLFHPRAFEKVIGDYLSIFYSELSDHRGNIQTYSAPLDWRAFSAGDVYGAYFKVSRTLTNHLGGGSRYFAFFPIDSRTMGRFMFDIARLGLFPEPSHDKISSLEPLYQLMNDIVGSIRVKLSPEGLQQKQLAQEGLEDASLVDYYPPIKWDKLDDQTRAAIIKKDEEDRIAKYGC